MPIRQMSDWVCDLCGNTKTVEEASIPRGWVDISIEDRHVDRMWHRKCLCSGCVKRVCSAIEDKHEAPSE
jgi:hypothetical protein